MNSFQVAAGKKDVFIKSALDRELFFDTNDFSLFVVYEGKFIPFGAVPDNFNIISKDGNLSLNDNVFVKTTVSHSDSDMSGQDTDNRCVKLNDNVHNIVIYAQKGTQDFMSGIVTFTSLSSKEMYEVDVFSNGKGSIKGASSHENKASLVEINFEGTIYYGIQFPNGNRDIYFHGYGGLSHKSLAGISRIRNIQITRLDI